MSRQEPARLEHPLGDAATAAALPETSASVASSRELFPYLTQVPVSQGGAYPRRQDINALIKLLGASTFFTESGGVWSYDPARAGDYSSGDVVWYDPGADLYADLPVSTDGGYTIDTVLLSAVAAASGYPAGAAMLFIRNRAPAGAGSMTPAIPRAGLMVVNSAYWSPVLGLEQYGRLYDAIQHAGGGGTPTPVDPVDWATVGQVLDLFRAASPVIQVDTSDLSAGQAYIYITDESDNPVGGGWPGTPLTMTGAATGVWSSYTLPDTTAAYSMILSAGDRQTAAISWLGDTGLQSARGHLIKVADGSSTWEVVS